MSLLSNCEGYDPRGECNDRTRVRPELRLAPTLAVHPAIASSPSSSNAGRAAVRLRTGEQSKTRGGHVRNVGRSGRLKTRRALLLRSQFLSPRLHGSLEVLAVKSRELSPAVRMARKLCKALSASFVMKRSQLQEAACREVVIDRRKGSPWSRANPPSPEDFEAGLSHALSAGWVSESEGSIHLTPAGADIAYRLRVSQRKF